MRIDERGIRKTVSYSYSGWEVGGTPSPTLQGVIPPLLISGWWGETSLAVCISTRNNGHANVRMFTLPTFEEGGGGYLPPSIIFPEGGDPPLDEGRDKGYPLSDRGPMGVLGSGLRRGIGPGRSGRDCRGRGGPPSPPGGMFQ